MIIECVNSSKKFEVNSELIPVEGRTIQCGSCNHVWFFKKNNEDLSVSRETQNDENIDKSPKKIDAEKAPINLSKNKEREISSKGSEIIKYKSSSSFKIGRLLSYIIVIIITFIALILVVDTFKYQLYSLFPNLESFLFNLYETLKDIELFIKDLL